MKLLSIVFALACVTLVGCRTQVTFPDDTSTDMPFNDASIEGNYFRMHWRIVYQDQPSTCDAAGVASVSGGPHFPSAVPTITSSRPIPPKSPTSSTLMKTPRSAPTPTFM